MLLIRGHDALQKLGKALFECYVGDSGLPFGVAIPSLKNQLYIGL